LIPRPEDVSETYWDALMTQAEINGWTFIDQKRVKWWREVTFEDENSRFMRSVPCKYSVEKK
jgi:hypothetical protein